MGNATRRPTPRHIAYMAYSMTYVIVFSMAYVMVYSMAYVIVYSMAYVGSWY